MLGIGDEGMEVNYFVIDADMSEEMRSVTGHFSWCTVTYIYLQLWVLVERCTPNTSAVSIVGRRVW